MAKFPYVLSQHNCVIDYIPYLDAFEITRKVAVQGGDTPIHAVVRAATGLISESRPRILRKGCSRYAFFRILSAVKRSTAEIQRSQTVKSLFAMWSSGQAAKMMVKIS